MIAHGAAGETTTLKVQVAKVLFDASFAEQFTAVVPTGKLEPEGGVQVLVLLGQPLEVGDPNVTTAAFEPAGLSVANTSSGQRRTQTRLFTCTVKLHVSVLLELFVLSQLTVVVPIGKLDPDGGEQSAAGTAQVSGKVGAA